MKKHLVFAVVPFLALGCGEDLKDANGDGIADGVREPDSVTVVTPASPKGTVSGQVLGTRYTPLEGVTVEMTIGSSADAVAANTDAKGNFEFTDVPAGAEVLLTFSRPGFATLRSSSVIPSSAGNVPINNGNASFGPVVLAALDGTLKFNLLTPNGRPAAGAKASLHVDVAGKVLAGPSERTSSSVVVDADAGPDGVVTFSGVPSPLEMDRLNSQYKLIVNALDANGDGVLDAGGRIEEYSGATLATTGIVHTLALPAPSDTGAELEIDYTNLSSLLSAGASFSPQDNMLRSGEAIYIAFNQPVHPGSVTVGLANEYGLSEGLSLAKNLLQGNTILSLAPSGSLQAGREYNLYVRAVSAVSNQPISKTVSFVSGDPTPPAINVDSTVRFYDLNNNGQLNSGEYVALSFNQVMLQRGSSVEVFFRGVELDGAPASTSVGEWVDGNRNITGFTLSTFEPPYLFGGGGVLADPRPDFPAASANGYSTRFLFRYLPAGAAPTVFNSGNSVTLVLAFGLLRNPSSDVYESAWGVPQTSTVNVSATLVAIPMPAP